MPSHCAFTREHGAERFIAVRTLTEKLTASLCPEDTVIQSMPDVSPTKWHMAHTSWFFETFVLSCEGFSYEHFNTQFNYLFNSYYNSVGAQFPRASRGLLARPTLLEVRDYRRHVNAAMARFFRWVDEGKWAKLGPVVELGLHHEQQHQELLLTDIKHVFAFNPLSPVYCEQKVESPGDVSELVWFLFAGGLNTVGHDFSDGAFAFDNEGPLHQTLVQPFELADRLVTCGEYKAFMAAGGYDIPTLWLSNGWAWLAENPQKMPLYWQKKGDDYYHMTLSGLVPVRDDEPVCHLSYYEADAYASWAGARLPTEFEWEVAAQGLPIEGDFVESGRLHPSPAGAEAGLKQMYGSLWQWTRSAYGPYPGYKAQEGALGEYNGKFMCSQIVLRGGSVATSVSHIRRSYRNFFPPEAQWQFMGLRLARDVS